MPREVQQRLEDIERRCQRIVNHTEDYDKEEFFREEWNLDASLYNLIIIGEAVKNLPDSLREEHRERIPFDSIAGARDIYAHEYFRLNHDLIWETLTKKIPELLNEIRIINEVSSQ